MVERCTAIVEYNAQSQGEGFLIDEFGRKTKLSPEEAEYWGYWNAVIDTRYEARVDCGLCQFQSAKLVEGGETRRQAFTRARTKVRQFLLEYCEAGKK